MLPPRPHALLAAACTAVIVRAAAAPLEDCPARPAPGAAVTNPREIVASGGMLRAALTMRSREMAELPLKICYIAATAESAAEAPTLRLAPGDRLDLALTDRLTYQPRGAPSPTASAPPHDPCAGGIGAPTSTNLDFPGLDLPPVCHQGETVATTIENADPPFHYIFQLPPGTPPGLDLYRPQRIGSAALQVESGASGALVVGGMARAKPEVAGLPERILIVREQTDEPDEPGSDSRITLNFEPIGYRDRPPPLIRMRPGAREFWRVANASAGVFLALRVMRGEVPQPVRLIALDGVPLAASRDETTIALPPGGRAEFIVAAPAAGQEARLMQAAIDTGPTGPEMPARALARIAIAADAAVPPPMAADGALPAWTRPPAHGSTLQRRLYFAEAPNGTNGPTRYLLTVEGQRPRIFDPAAPPAIVTRVGAVEDWKIANRTGEVQAFRLQGMHGLLLAAGGESFPTPDLRDTVTVPPWRGTGNFPNVTLRLDFGGQPAGSRIAESAILRRAEGGMMARVRIDPH